MKRLFRTVTADSRQQRECCCSHRLAAQRVQSHGRASHHVGRRGQHDRRVCLRPGRERPESRWSRLSASTPSKSRASDRTSSTSTTTCSTRFTWRPAATSRPAARRIVMSSKFKTVVQEPEDDPAVVSQRHQERGRCGAESDTVLHGHEGGSSNGRPDALGEGVVPPNNQGNATPFYNQGRQRREPRQGWRGDRGRARPSTPGSPSRRWTAAMWRSRASATTASMPTSSRSSIC